MPLVALRRFLADPAAHFLRTRMGLRLPDEIDVSDDLDPLTAPSHGLDRWRLQQHVFDACVEGDTDDLARHLRARAMLPSGPLGERQLAAIKSQVLPFASTLRRWREGDAQTHAFELDLDGVRLYGHLERLYPHGALRARLDTLNGTAQISHGLDWLVLSALGDTRPLAQLAQWEDGPEVRLREPIPPAQARQALRALLALRREGLREPLPVQARSAWLWYSAPRSDEAGEIAAWKAAREQWFGSERKWGEVNSAAVQLALRGCDPFLDDTDGARFRELATRLFDAVVFGRVADAGATA
jgi:exodeoxyribonuclease V gamma subunit